MEDDEVSQISCIIENKLYLSGMLPIRKISSVKDLCITHILSLTSLDECHENEQKFITKHLKINDDLNTDITKYAEELINFIVEGTRDNNKILVHCGLGVSRSPAVICLYLMKIKNMKMQEALSYIQSKRSIVQPNKAFLEQLKKYENELLM